MRAKQDEYQQKIEKLKSVKLLDIKYIYRYY